MEVLDTVTFHLAELNRLHELHASSRVNVDDLVNIAPSSTIEKQSSDIKTASPGPIVSDVPLLESERQELERLKKTVQQLTSTNDRIMAQNIALLADLETAQKAVRELRASKDTLAVQLKRLLEK